MQDLKRYEARRKKLGEIHFGRFLQLIAFQMRIKNNNILLIPNYTQHRYLHVLVLSHQLIYIILTNQKIIDYYSYTVVYNIMNMKLQWYTHYHYMLVVCVNIINLAMSLIISFERCSNIND